LGQARKWLVLGNRVVFVSNHVSWPLSNNIYLVLAGKWIEFDDDNPKPRVEDDITRLSGGGEIT